MQDTWNQNFLTLSKDLPMFAIREKPFEQKAEPTSCRKSEVLSLIHCGFAAVNFFQWWGIRSASIPESGLLIRQFKTEMPLILQGTEFNIPFSRRVFQMQGSPLSIC